MVQREECFYFEAPDIALEALERIKRLLDQPGTVLDMRSVFTPLDMEEIGRRRAVESSYSTRAVAICKRIGVDVSRAEMSVRYSLLGTSREAIRAKHLDPMLEEVYATQPETFATGELPANVLIIPVREVGVEILRRANNAYRIGLNEKDISFVADLCESNPTDAALKLLSNNLSEHCAHSTIKSPPRIDGVLMPPIMDVVQRPWKVNPGENLLAFHDNAGVFKGSPVRVLVPENPGEFSRMVFRDVVLHITITAETHNFPCYRAPFPGAQTGVGGVMRDGDDVGRGAFLAGILHSAYMVSNPEYPDGYTVPGAEIIEPKNIEHASAIEAVIGMSNGACSYANEYGQPIIGGSYRVFDQRIGERRYGWVRPICYVANVSRIANGHVHKKPMEAGMLLIGLGGPALPVGYGGGTASSSESGAHSAELDFAAVQRGDAQTARCAHMVLQACAQMGEDNPIINLSDQGAGGPGNLFLELVGKLGGTIDIEKITCLDPTMSATMRLNSECQERHGFVIKPGSLPILEKICKRENTNLEVVGEITGNGRFIVLSREGTIVDLSMHKLLAGSPPAVLEWNHVPKALKPLEIPPGRALIEEVQAVFAQGSVHSKGFLVRKGDRAVTGRVARQQCCGPYQLPVANCAVMADSMFSLTGSASAQGEQPIKGIISAKAGGRMSVAEMFTNLCSAGIVSLGLVETRLNEMCAVKQPGMGAELYDYLTAASELHEYIRARCNGGKDSLSMATNVASGELVVAPVQLIVFGAARMQDIRRVVTPDLKGNGRLVYIDIGRGKYRLGGSAYAQSYGQLGNETPDIDDCEFLYRVLSAVLELVKSGLVTAYHDRSDGGLITTLAEMCMAGNCGAYVTLPNTELRRLLFSEEAGVVVEYQKGGTADVNDVLERHGVTEFVHNFGETGLADRSLMLVQKGMCVFREHIKTMRTWWEKTSDAIELGQANPETVRQEIASYDDDPVRYHVPFTPAYRLPRGRKRPKVAVIGTEGSNGEDELRNTFARGNFDVDTIHMNDFFSGALTSLERYQCVGYPGGFADADTFGAARGWALSISENKRVKAIFDAFMDREDTLSFGICNGAQFVPQNGWVPDRALPSASWPRLLENTSGRFESRWSAVKVLASHCVFCRGMENMVFGICSDHGEGRFYFPDRTVEERVWSENLVPLVYVGPDGEATERYPYNPNGSPGGMAGLTDVTGRHLITMPHPERCSKSWQCNYVPSGIRMDTDSPWLYMIQNAYDWCLD